MRLLFVLCGALLLSVSIHAQSPSTLRGQILDEFGAVIPGASVKLIGADGRERTASANANGEFSLPNVPAGTYTLTVDFNGFQPYIDSQLRVPVAEGSLKITMAVAAVAIETEVKSEEMGVTVEPDQNASATVLNEEFVKTLPDNEDELRDYLQALAGPAAGGAAGGQGGAQIYVNGFSGGRLPPRDAIMQIRINQNPFSAEYSRPGFGRVDIITKPGNDSWRGNAGFSYRNSALDARNAFALEKPDLNQQRYQFNIGGPIIKKKMSFFANIERRNLIGQSTVVATTLNGPFVTNIDAPSDNLNLNVRTDYLVTNKNTLSVNYSFFDSTTINSEFAQRFGGFGFGGGGGFGFGGGGAAQTGNYTLPERASDRFNRNHELQLTNTHVLNSRTIIESRLEYDFNSSEVRGRTEGFAINVLDAFNGGGATCCPNDSRDHQIEWQQYATITLKKHTIKGGFQLEYTNTYDYSPNNFNGTYTFSSLDLYRRAVEGEVIVPTVGARVQFTINRGNPELRVKQTEASWFFNDDFRLSPTLTLSFGLRHEFQTNLDDKSNFAPRLGIAWSPFKDRKTTIRAGGGLFYSRFTSNLYGTILRYTDNLVQSYVVNNPPFPIPADFPLARVDSISRVTDPNIKAPYSASFNVSVERQLPFNLVSAVTYIYTKGINQYRSRNINAPRIDPVTGEISRPNPNAGNIFQLESSASSVFNGFQFRVNRQFSRRFTFFGNYSLSWTENDADGSFSTPANNYTLEGEWGRASTDRRHFAAIGGFVNLPWGFRLSPFIMVGSGSPYNITTGIDDNRDTSFTDRPAGIGRNSDLPADLYPLIPNRCLSNCGLGLTPIGLRDYLYANFPNGVIAENPGLFNVNLNVSKTFGFGRRDGAQAANATQAGGGGGDRGGRGGGGGGGGRGGFGGGGGGGMRGMGGPGGGMMGGGMGGGSESSRFTVQLSAQISNLFNRVNFGPYSGTLGSPYFSRPNSAGAARQFEFNIRFGF